MTNLSRSTMDQMSRGSPVAYGKNVLSTIVQSSTVELFGCYGVAVAPLSQREATPGLAEGFIGTSLSFSSAVMTGALALYLPAALIALLGAPKSARYSEVEPVRELGNQMLGRLKNRLLAFHIELHSGLPCTIAPRLGPSSRRKAEQEVDYGFRFLRGEFLVSIVGRIDFSSIVYTGWRPVAKEGELLLF